MMKNNRYLVTLVVYGTAMVLLMLTRILFSSGCFSSWSDQAVEVLGSVLPQMIIMFGIPFFMLLGAQKINHEPVSLRQINQTVGWHRLSSRAVLLCIVLGVCVFFLNGFIASIFASLLESFGWQSSSNASDIVFKGYSGLVIAMLLTAVLPGICEEFLHRGVLLNGLLKQLGVRRALLWSSIMFGLMHMYVGQFFYATILGWLMGMTVLATGSLWGSIIIHFMNNALATYFTYASKEVYLPGLKLISGMNPIVSLLLILVAVLLIGEILRSLARDKFNRNIDSYTVRYLATQKQFNVEDFDRLKAALPTALQTLPTWKATAAYIETFDQPQAAKPLERALFTFIILIGTAMTVMSFVWGTW